MNKEEKYKEKFEQEVFDMFEASMFDNKTMLEILDRVRTKIVNTNLRGE